MPLVFQYGSNTSVKRLNSAARLNGAAKVIGPAYTKEKYELDFTVWSRGNDCAAADIVPEGNTTIWGVLYEISEELIYRHLSGERKSLDAIEGEGSNYERTEIEVISNTESNNSISALTYVVRERKKELKTSAAYATEVLNGLNSHDIPNSYLEYVYKRILLNNNELKHELPTMS